MNPGAELFYRAVPVLEKVDPLPCGKLVGEGTARHHVLDPDGDHDQPVVPGKHQFFFDFVGIVGVLGENEQHQFGGADRVDDRLSEILARIDVAARNPAGEPFCLKGRADSIGDPAVLRRVTDKDFAHAEISLKMLNVILAKSLIREKRCHATVWAFGCVLLQATLARML